MRVDLDAFTGRKPRALPDWDPSMCRPLLFDAALAREEAGPSFPSDLTPIAVFFRDDACTQLADQWAFIAVDAAQGVFLVDDEGPRSLEQSLSEFLASLDAP